MAKKYSLKIIVAAMIVCVGLGMLIACGMPTTIETLTHSHDFELQPDVDHVHNEGQLKNNGTQFYNWSNESEILRHKHKVKNNNWKVKVDPRELNSDFSVTGWTKHNEFSFADLDTS
jgi:hypothetical protein